MHPVAALFDRNAWATEVLLRWCALQRPEVVSAGGDDVYGSIESLFNHVLGAETRYLRLLTGELPAAAVNERTPLPLAELGDRAEQIAGAWVDLLEGEREVETLRPHERGGGRSEMPDWIPIVQALHHGDDHRTQVGTLLLRAGLVMPELGVWDYAFYNSDSAEPGPSFAGPILRHCFGYHLWATQVVLERCARLGDEELALSAEGTLGSILEGCRHLVGSDIGYWSRLVGQKPSGNLDEAGIDDLLGAWGGQQERWPAYLAGRPDFDAGIEGSGGSFKAWVRVAQAFHHGNDHRTQIGTTLMHHGLEVPDLDVWAYGLAEGVLRELA